MSLTSDLKSPKSPVGTWARQRFANTKRLYPLLKAAAEPVQVRPTGWGDGRDQRWSWSGMACDTMLRWRLGATDPAHSVEAGARLLLGELEGTGLGELISRVPDAVDTAQAARIAVLWALAEQHVRHAPTENPLTPIARQPAEQLLAAAPDDVVADVAAVIDGPAAALVTQLGGLGAVEVGRAFRYPGGADLDLLIGSAVVEVKTTVSRPGPTDVLQALCYALLAEPGQIDELIWAFPRSGKLLRLPVADVIDEICDAPASSDVVRAELYEAARIPVLR